MPADRGAPWLPVRGTGRAWGVGTRIVLVGFVAMIVALFTIPDHALRLLWFGVVPALPALFLVNAELWRNVCPLATLNTLVDDESGAPMGPRASRVAAAVGVVLLLLAIPMRVVIFNDSGVAAGTLLAAAGLFALVSGIPFQRKAGFCNSVCPVLPVERLYGQSPLLRVGNTRCTPCQVCTRAACYDLNPGRSGLQIMGAGASRLPWKLLPFGIFALSFPGVIAGYAAATTQGRGVLAIPLAGVTSWLVLALLFTVARVGPALGLLLAASLSAGFFYWFMPVSIAAAFGASSATVVLLRCAGLGLVAVWTFRALRRRHQRRRESGRPTPADPRSARVGQSASGSGSAS